MKRIKLFTVLMLAGAVAGLSSCDLFGDEEHCLYETNESRYWTPSQYPAFAVRDSSLTFTFNRSDILSERSYKIDNVCPFGALAVKVKVSEKGSLFAPRPLRYRMLVVEVMPNSSVYKIRKIIQMYRQSDTEVKGEGIVELADFGSEGSRSFFVGCAAIFEPGTFTDLLTMEDWGKENVTQVDFTATFVKWE